MKILVTGAAGFIGYHLCESLIEQGHEVIGLDNINDYYDVNLKYARLKQLGIDQEKAEVFGTISNSSTHDSRFQFIRMYLEDREELPKLFQSIEFNMVCNLAAQAGVRYSFKNPEAYVDSNIQGFMNILECCRHHNLKRLVYASSSSVYGDSDQVPFIETQNVDTPVSLYAATKKANELMAHTYSHLYGIETIGLRLFTVYGPWGRPDMAMFLFTDAILNDRPIRVFNNGDLARDFTYIDDIIIGIEKTLFGNLKDDNIYQLYNIGNNSPVQLLDFIKEIESCTQKDAEKIMLPMQEGDVYRTFADSTKLMNQYNYRPNTSIKKGVGQFVKWYKNFYNVK